VKKGCAETKNPGSIMAAIDTRRKFPSAIAAGGDGAMEFLFL